MVTNFNYNNSYELFLAQESYNQDTVLQYSNECIQLESGNINGLVAITEGVGDGVKSIINKIIEVISGLWRKFSERMGEWFMSKANYLKKYEKIITNTGKYPVKEREIKMYKYNIAAITDTDGIVIPSLSVADIVTDDFLAIGKGSDDEKMSAFIKKYLSGKVKAEPDKKFQDIMERYYYGSDEEEDMKTTTMPIPISKMYTYAINWKATKAQMDKNTAQIQKNSEVFTAAIDKALVDVKVPEKKQGATGTESEKTESVVWSSVLGTYLTEMEVKKEKENTTGAQASDVGDQGVNKDTKDMMANTAKTASAIPTPGANAAPTVEEQSKKLEEIKDAGRAFFNFCGDIISAKATVASRMYKEFFILMKLHVRDYVKDADNDDTDKKDDKK